MAVFDWYVLLLILANFKEYRINVTKSRMRLSLILSKLYKTLWIWYYQINHPAVLLHFKCSKGFRSVAGGAHLCAFWNLPDLLIIGEPSLPSHKHKGMGKNNKNAQLHFCSRICQWDAARVNIEVHRTQRCCYAWWAGSIFYTAFLWGRHATTLANSDSVHRHMKTA